MCGVPLNDDGVFLLPVFFKEYQKVSLSFTSLSQVFQQQQEAQLSSRRLTNAVANTARAVNSVAKMFATQPINDLEPLMAGLGDYRGLLAVFPDTLLVYRVSIFVITFIY